MAEVSRAQTSLPAQGPVTSVLVLPLAEPSGEKPALMLPIQPEGGDKSQSRLGLFHRHKNHPPTNNRPGCKPLDAVIGVNTKHNHSP